MKMAMETIPSRRLLIASLAGALALPALAGATAAEQQAPAAEKVKCYGVNKCKGTGDCGGPGHSCANQNACKRKGYVEMDKDTCLRLDGGRLTPNEEPAKGGEKK
jgi:uncharacterized membrane protein